ncbi:hypothetical protein JKP88DRAFT_207430, partial [Tribonema minus]
MNPFLHLLLRLLMRLLLRLPRLLLLRLPRLHVLHGHRQQLGACLRIARVTPAAPASTSLPVPVLALVLAADTGGIGHAAVAVEGVEEAALLRAVFGQPELVVVGDGSVQTAVDHVQLVDQHLLRRPASSLSLRLVRLPEHLSDALV